MKLIIWGASGHGKVVLDVAYAMGAFEEIVFVDDAPATPAMRFCGCELLTASDGIEQLKRRGYLHFFMAVGDNQNRARCFGRALACDLVPATLIHPDATVSGSARAGRGTLVMPRVVVNADAVIGENCIINTGAIVEHDCKIGDHSHISPGAILGGGVRIGCFAHLGIGVNVLPMAVIGEGAVVGAGAVVLAEIPAGVTAVGVPARVLARRVD